MPRWLKIILSILAGFVIFASLIVGAGFWFTSALVVPIDRQIAALKAGDMRGAYEETAQAFRQATPMADFTAFVEANPILKNVASHSFLNRSFDNDAGMVEGTLTSSAGSVLQVTYQLVKEKAEWTILQIQLATAGESAETP